MAITGTTKRMIDLYMEEAPAPMFLSGLFQSPAKNFHTSEKVMIDIDRDEEEVAIVIQDLKAGPRQNESALYTAKEFKPPIFDEEGVITAFSQIERRAGADPFQEPDYAANATEEAFSVFNKNAKKIRRAIEMMASQVLQSGTLTLRDKTGAALYTLDFKPKSTHFPTASAWATDPLAELATLAKVLRRDGKGTPYRLIFGEAAFTSFIGNTKVQAALDNRGMALGQVAPQVRGEGATFQGWIWIGHYRFEMWTYDGYYKDPSTGVMTPYVADNSVIMLSKNSRLDLTWGAIPLLRKPVAPALAFLPPRFSSSEGLLDLSVNAYFTPDGKRLMVGCGTRPLTIPTGIDTYGCLTTGA